MSPLLQRLQTVAKSADSIVLGKPRIVRLGLACLLARGHLLMEDLPGVGKTTLAHALANLLGLQFQRIQFTSDLLPADILGVSLFDREKNAFRFLPGPVFTQVVLADEINRATPKTQSALLEAMEERRVTIEGKPTPLPSPFFVIATQNPTHQIGTFPLPESQLDRFLMRLELGYPDRAAERQLLEGQGGQNRASRLSALCSPEDLLAAQHEASQVHAAPALLDYLQDLIEATRRPGELAHGLSPRAGLGLLHAARAHAWLRGQDTILPEDVQAVFLPVVRHRLRHTSGGFPGEAFLQQLLHSVRLP